METTKNFVAKLEALDSAVYNRHFMVPEDVAAYFLDNNQKRLVCTLTNSMEIRSGLMPNNGQHFILMNQANCKKLKLQIGDLFEVSLKADTSKYGMELPEEMEVLLDENDDFSKHFSALTPGKQRNLLHLVNKIKNKDSRINKALAICDHLCEVNGALDFKKLNEKIKLYNNKTKLK